MSHIKSIWKWMSFSSLDHLDEFPTASEIWQVGVMYDDFHHFF
jgi:hypothetical protein